MDSLLAKLRIGSSRKKKRTSSRGRSKTDVATTKSDASGSGSSVGRGGDSCSISSVFTVTSCSSSAAEVLREEALHQEVVAVGGRNLLNKKEQGPPSTIKESSESSQTIDDNDSEKGGGQLKHENTVVRADGAIGGGIGGVSSNSSTASKSSSTNQTAQKSEIVRVTQQLLDAISCKDFDAYARLCDTTMTSFEPEALGNLIEGIEFHRFYFDGSNANRKSTLHTTMLNPNVHIVGEDGACIAYVKLTQYLDKNGESHTRQSQESRVWSKKQSRWVCIHVHRSTQPTSSSTVSEF